MKLQLRAAVFAGLFLAAFDSFASPGSLDKSERPLDLAERRRPGLHAHRQRRHRAERLGGTAGDLFFFIGKTDAWDENLRLLKLARMRVKLDPDAGVTNAFHWSCSCVTGSNRHTGTQQPTSRSGSMPTTRSCRWTAKSLDRCPSRPPLRSRFGASRNGRLVRRQRLVADGYLRPATRLSRLFSYPTFRSSLPPGSNIGWYHRNVDSPWLAEPEAPEARGHHAQTDADPILNRTVGAIMRGENLVAVSDTEIKTASPAPASPEHPRADPNHRYARPVARRPGKTGRAVEESPERDRR